MTRLYSVSDYLNLNSFSVFHGPQFDISDCGKKLCFSCYRGRELSPPLWRCFMGGTEGSQLFIWEEGMADPRHIEEPSGTSLFSPLWSPDGTKIAAGLTNAEGCFPVLIEVETGKIKTLSKRCLGMRPRHKFA